MPENLALYTAEHATLPEDQMRGLMPGLAPDVGTTDRGLTYAFNWPDLTILCSEMPGQGMSEHLEGFVGYVKHVCRGVLGEREKRLIERIRSTKLVVGIEIDPGRDPQERADELVGKLCSGLKPIMFFDNALYEWDGRLLLGPDGSSDSESTM